MLLFIDNIFRFTHAGSESIGAAGPHAFDRRISAEPGVGNGRIAGTHYVDKEGIDRVEVVDMLTQNRQKPACFVHWQ